MSPPASEKTGEMNQEDIVISGLSGRFPESNNVEEFKRNLLEGIDMITDEPKRWPAGLHGLPKRFGKLKDLTSFDARYFGVHAKQAEQLDPQIRMLLEVTQEAILDAGYNPHEIRGTKCGVFMGICASESLEYWEKDSDEMNGYGLTGCSRSMFANRITYAFDFKGPSFTIDTACSSSAYALSQAIKAIKSGECDSAIVGGATLLLKPNACLHFHRLGMLSPEGACKSFDSAGNGYARSEAATVIFLQKADVARRVYATVLGAKTNSDGYKDKGITYPSGKMQLKLIQDTYAETGIDPTQINYVEAHGTGTKVGDPEEANAIADFFCQNRKDPLLIGSVKSNMGHSEGASALCSIAKIIVAMEVGIIPRNLHFQTPNPEIPSLIDGRLKVVTENQPWNGGLVAVNSFGFGGANAHIILQSNTKSKIKLPTTNIPRVIGVSGRTEEAVKELLEVIDKNEEDEEFLSLIQQIHKIPITGHNFRGYKVLDDLTKPEISIVPSERRPIWFVYPGMGSQWAQMGKDFMRLDIFRDSIKKTARVLRPFGIDIENLIEHGTDEMFENIINAYVAITAIQIAFTDILKILEIRPDGIIGHSFGEVGCAYADGTLTAEQAILCTLQRGVSVIESKSPPGCMASVGLSWKEAKDRCPPLVYPACHNSESNVTISGEPKELKKFLATLVSEDVMVREVKSAGFAFHCRHIKKAAPLLQKYLESVIPDPKARSSKWISTSVPESSWNTPIAQLSSPEYFVNNLLSPVLFQEGIKHIPKNALVIEIAPTGLFQGILKRSIGTNCSTVSLAKKGHIDNVGFLLLAVGKIYAAGAQPNLDAFYKSPGFPVGRGTPMISSHIKWDHSVEWTVASFQGQDEQSGEFMVEVDQSKDENKYLAGHKIDGRILFPGAGYLVLVWKTFAKLKNQEYEKMPVIFEDIQFHRATILSSEGSVKFSINIFTGTGAFELCEGGSLVASGKIRTPDNLEKETTPISKVQMSSNDTDLPLTQDDIYKDLHLRGYEYCDEFKGIIKSDNSGNEGEILWNNNWTCFIDTILQFSIINKDTKDLHLPTRLQKVIIDPINHFQTQQSSSTGTLSVYFNKYTGVVKCGGIEARGLKAAVTPKRQKHKSPKLEKYQFVPYENNGKLNKIQALTILSQIITENTSGISKLKLNDVILNGQIEQSLSIDLKHILENEPLVSVEATLVSSDPVDMTSLDEHNIKYSSFLQQNVNLAVCYDLLSQNNVGVLKDISTSILDGGFILLAESTKIPSNINSTDLGLQVVSIQRTEENCFVLLRKIVQEHLDSIMINVSYTDFSWVQSVKDAINSGDECAKIYIYSEEKFSGLIGMVNTLRKEPGGERLRSIFIRDNISRPFTMNNYADQLKKDLVHNVLKEGVWGCYRHLPLEDVEEMNKKLVSHAIINTLTRGDLTSLRWIESPLSTYKPRAEDIGHVYYASLNFRDVMLATGKLPPDALPGNLAGQENILGLEYAGRDSKGQRLMGLVESRCLATTVLLDHELCWKVPDKWSLEQAATIPVVYATAYYSLIVRGQLRPGESVLIHAGSGGVGIASICLALHMGCQVFTTVSSQTKRDFLKKTFPELTDRNIGYSRDTSFEQFILSETGGKGVDVVLNSLAADQLQASVRCLAINGRFLEIGKVDLSNNSPLGMNVFLKNISFHGILVDALFLPGMTETKNLLVKLIDEGIRSGAVQPLPCTVFKEDQIEESFRYMASGKHIGKVVIKIRDEEPQKCIIPKPKLVSAIARAYMHPKKCYILIGGLGDFGLELTNWLVNRGATKIVLSSRSGVKKGYQSLSIRKWKERGTKILISTENITTESGTRRLIEEAKHLGPIGGIFNLAAVLKDCLMENQTAETFKICCDPKVTGTIFLDKVSRELKDDLDYFVVFSSIASGRGNVGQANYSFANSVMEQICEDRQENGHTGLAIQWGPVGDVGLAMELFGGSKYDEMLGVSPQRIVSCLETMDTLLGQSVPIVSSFVLADTKNSENDNNKLNMIDAIADILGLKDRKNWPENVTFSELGMDSLMSAEIKHSLERNFDIFLNASEIRALTLSKLSELEAKNISSDKISGKPAREHGKQKYGEVMPLETLVNMTGKDVNHSKTPLFIIHPIEGHVRDLLQITKQIDAPVYGLQCTSDAPLDSIENLAKFYLKHIKSIQPTGIYKIVGYSFGASVAFELGTQLENEGHIVELWFIDGSPLYVSVHMVKARANKAIESDTVAEESEFLVFFMQKFEYIDQRQIVADLMKLSTWEERLSQSMNILSELTALPENELCQAASSYYYRIKAAEKYKASKKFHGKVCLMKASDNDIDLGKDYSLSEICQQTVKIVPVEGSHMSIVTGETAGKIANILQSEI